jgi:hypothetical protein
MKQLGSQKTDFMKFDTWIFFNNLSRKFKFIWYLARTAGTSLEDVCTFIIISRRMTNISDKDCWKNQNIYFKFKFCFL